MVILQYSKYSVGKRREGRTFLNAAEEEDEGKDVEFGPRLIFLAKWHPPSASSRVDFGNT